MPLGDLDILRHHIDAEHLRPQSDHRLAEDAAAAADVEDVQAGKWLFDRGCDVQSATYPAVPLNAGLLRILVNANHSDEAMTGLLAALGEMKEHFQLGRLAVSAKDVEEMRERGLKL